MSPKHKEIALEKLQIVLKEKGLEGSAKYPFLTPKTLWGLPRWKSSQALHYRHAIADTYALVIPKVNLEHSGGRESNFKSYSSIIF